MGCFLLLLVIISPRLAMVGIWLLTDWEDRAFSGGWLIPLLGIVFLPWTTLLYTLGYIVTEAAAPWGVLGIIVGLFLDIAVHAGSAVQGRQRYSSS